MYLIRLHNNNIIKDYPALISVTIFDVLVVESGLGAVVGQAIEH